MRLLFKSYVTVLKRRLYLAEVLERLKSLALKI
jgi:hypothetical protein